MKLADLLAPAFVEGRVLPLVLAFAFGVLVHDIAGDAEVDRARIQARQTAIYAEQVRALCGAQPDPERAVHALANQEPHK
jgi:hypothetical protein